MRKIIITITILWVINEVLQITQVFYQIPLFNFFLFHLSSLYGAMIFCFLVNHLKFKKILFFAPLVIEIFLSWLTSHTFDFWDLIFSLIGISTVYLILQFRKEKEST
jgi:hypothetical protein